MDYACGFEALLKPYRFIISPLKIAMQFWLKTVIAQTVLYPKRASVAIWGIILINMALKQPSLTEVPKTESGATIGSTGEVVDARVNRLLIQKEKERTIRRANEEADARKKGPQEEGSVNTR